MKVFVLCKSQRLVPFYLAVNQWDSKYVTEAGKVSPRRFVAILTRHYGRIQERFAYRLAMHPNAGMSEALASSLVAMGEHEDLRL
jgi:hypothetical protein